MHYVDLGKGANPVDFGCGRLTYQGHDGIDFGIANVKVMNAGVPVTAAASGVVKRIRDGVDDHLVTNEYDKRVIKNIACGNGLVIDHGSGWQTQYCHLRKGSIVVKPNQRVDKGDVLGMVGSSGLASFPHVHFTVRYQGKIVDPFVGVNDKPGCKVERHPLWEQSIEYVRTGIIDSGFAQKRPRQTELWEGQHTNTRAKLKSLSALIFWVHVYGVLKGDREHFRLISPNGQVVIDNKKDIVRDYRSWIGYAGKGNKPDSQLSRGVWKGEYRLYRGGMVMVNAMQEFIIE